MQTLAASFHGNLHKPPYPLGSSCQIDRVHRGPDRLGPKRGRAGLSQRKRAKSWCCSFDTLLHPHTTTRNAPPHSATAQYPFCPSRLARPSPSFSLGCELHAARCGTVESLQPECVTLTGTIRILQQLIGGPRRPPSSRIAWWGVGQDWGERRELRGQGWNKESAMENHWL